MEKNDYSKKGKSERVMSLLFRLLKGERLSIKQLAAEYEVSTRSLTRDIDALKLFISENKDIFKEAELIYSASDHCYIMKMDTFLSNGELAVIAKVLIGSRVLSKKEIETILDKLVANTSGEDKKKVIELITNEKVQYSQPYSDTNNIDPMKDYAKDGSLINSAGHNNLTQSLTDNIWRLTECINERKHISITYYRMDRQITNARLFPASIMYNDGYFYLIAFNRGKKSADQAENQPLYYRVDRIIRLIVHRTREPLNNSPSFDEGFLRNRSQFMWPGPLRKVKFEFTGPSINAIRDKLPTAKILKTEPWGKNGQYKKYTIEAETYGNGIKMFLLSQGAWVKVLAPADLVEIMKKETKKMWEHYN